MKLYRDGKECNCDKDQFPAMEAAGWSKRPAEPKVEAPEAPAKVPAKVPAKPASKK